MAHYYIIAGEASGDMHAAALIKQIRFRDSEAQISGLGGDKMAAEGCTLHRHIRHMAFMGFAAVMKHQDAPGTTFKRHMRIAKGVLNEDDYLLQEILFNPYTHDQVSEIRDELKELLDIIDNKDGERMKGYLTKIRNHVKRDIERIK